MKKSIVITDLTRMGDGRVCVAGYDEQGQCIRPVLPYRGIQESSLYVHGHPIIFPFAVVEYELTQPDPQPPHTEDYHYNPLSVKLIESKTETQRREVLELSLFQSVSRIFEQPILTDPGHYVMDGHGPRSLGTILPKQVIQVIFEPLAESKWDYRLKFTDGENATYRLAITDLAWRYFCDDQRNKGTSPTNIISTLTHSLQSNTVYLRIGLARHWPKFPDRCFLQITGVYTFPDYLEGKNFADFAPR